jgi:outer membrane protein TolC
MLSRKEQIILGLVLSVCVSHANEIINKTVSLEQAIKIALTNSEKNRISKYDMQIAQAQYKQAMSANLPSLDLEIAAVKRDENIVNITQGEFTLPEDVSNMLVGIARDQMQAQIAALPPEQQAAAAAQAQASFNPASFGTFPLDFESVVMGDETIIGSLKMTYPLYTGGKISAIQKQARLGKEIANEKDKRTNQEIIFDVTKYYHGAMLAKNVTKLLEDTSARMDALNDLTKEMYEGGSENVKKTDYYRTSLAASTIKAFVVELSSNAKLAKSALIFSMGIDPQSEIKLVEKEDTKILSNDLNFFLENAYQHNTQLSTLTKAIEVYDAKIDEAKSEYRPNVGLFGSIDKVDNNYNGGMSNSQNDDSWSVGVGAQWNLFNGFRTTNEVEEAKLNKMKMKEQQNMLKNALALQVKKAYFDTSSNIKEVEILKETVKTAEANRDLNTRAYQADMVETKDVVEAQITEAQIKAKYFQSVHDRVLSFANLALVVGK